jgi:hypothetical protein
MTQAPWDDKVRDMCGMLPMWRCRMRQHVCISAMHVCPAKLSPRRQQLTTLSPLDMELNYGTHLHLWQGSHLDC